MTICLCACRGEAGVPPPRFAIYLAADIPDRAHRVDEPASFQHKLQEKPWLTEADIEFYDFSTHTIYLKKSKTVWLGPTGQAFVVFADGERCYIGYFQSRASSYLEKGPTITTMSLTGEMSGGVIKIEKYGMRGVPDARNATRLKHVLQTIYRGRQIKKERKRPV